MERKEIEPLTTREILMCAMHNEKAAAEKYCAIGETMLRANNTGTAKTFMEAAKVEKGHYMKLQKVLFKLYGVRKGGMAPKFDVSGCADNFGDNTCAAEATDGMSQEDAISFLERAEQDAVSFYLKAADTTERIDLKALFKSLADEESRHCRSVRKIARKAQTRRIQ